MPKQVVITVESAPDDLGRQYFTAEWFAGRRRGQCFRAVLADHIRYWGQQGYAVVLQPSCGGTDLEVEDK
jgi:hypothetical protein